MQDVGVTGVIGFSKRGSGSTEDGLMRNDADTIVETPLATQVWVDPQIIEMDIVDHTRGGTITALPEGFNYKATS